MKKMFLRMIGVVVLMTVSVVECRAQSARRKSDLKFSEAVGHYIKDDLMADEIVNKFSELSRGGDVRATMWLARIYFAGRCGVARNEEKAQKMAKKVIGKIFKLARKGDAEAMFLAGAAYFEGLGVKKDSKKSVLLYRKAFKQKHCIAINNLGHYYAKGYGVKPDIENARKLFALAQQYGSVRAIKNASLYSKPLKADKVKISELRQTALVKVLGEDKDKGIAYLKKKSLISNIKECTVSKSSSRLKYSFYKDGIILIVDSNNDRIINIEGHAGEESKVGQFRGQLPLGISWQDKPSNVRSSLGYPNDSGSVSSDNAYGMAYRCGNAFFSVMFSYQGDRKLKIWRVYEKWAVDYNAE